MKMFTQAINEKNVMYIETVEDNNINVAQERLLKNTPTH